jgi:hypothetical protein
MLDWSTTKDSDTWLVIKVRRELVDHMIFKRINQLKAERRWEVLGLERWKGILYSLMELHSVSMIG